MKYPAKTRVRRTAAAAALAVLAFGAAGCGAINQQATTIHYDASDGVSVWSNSIQVRNLLLVTNGEPKPARFIASVTNTGASDETLKVAFNGKSIELNVKSKETINLQDEKYAEQFTVPGAKGGKGKTTTPGLDVTVTVTPGNEAAQEIDVPVVNAAIKDYAPYVPGGADKDTWDHLTPSSSAAAEH